MFLNKKVTLKKFKSNRNFVTKYVEYFFLSEQQSVSETKFRPTFFLLHYKDKLK